MMQKTKANIEKWLNDLPTPIAAQDEDKKKLRMSFLKSLPVSICLAASRPEQTTLQETEADETHKLQKSQVSLKR